MPTIFTLGETVYDIIFDHDQPKAAKAGGSMLNTAVSLGRCGLKVEMITELGDDRVGRIILDFLKENGVSVSFIKPSSAFKTPVSLAFLDAKGNAGYSFYKNYPVDRLNFPWPVAGRGDVVLFGSFYSLDQDIRAKIISFVKKSKQNGALVIYDPNIRKNHLGEVRKLMHLVEENIALADIVRGSDEDFENLFDLNRSDGVLQKLMAMGCGCLVFTRKEGAELLCGDLNIRVPAREITVVSTIGAGDSFNAGIIYGLVSRNLTGLDPGRIRGEQWKEIIAHGIDFASDVCQGYENYISKDINNLLHGSNLA
jgi:fructokinase